MMGVGTQHNGPNCLVSYNYMLVSNVDASVAEALGCMLDGTTYLGYAGPNDASWLKPGYVTGTQGMPADGVIAGADRTYHMASHMGNATLPGDWTEVADTTAYTAGGIISGSPLAVKFNVMASMTRNPASLLQDGAVTAELPEAQKGRYNNVNFLVAAMDNSPIATHGARMKRIYALYGDGGTDAQLLWAWSESAGDLRPQMDNTGAPFSGFSPAYTCTQAYYVATTLRGKVIAATRTVYEFSAPFALNKNKVLWGFRLDDANPTMTTYMRGAAIWAATAYAASDEVGRPDPASSTVAASPDRIPADGSVPAVVTVTLMDENQNAVTGLEEAIDIAVSGDGTSTISFVGETEAGVYVYEFTNDARGVKSLTVTVDDSPPEDPIALAGAATVTVYDETDMPVANAGPDQVVVDADVSGDEQVLLDGSASSDPNGTLVSYVWSWYGQQVATGETAAATLDVGAWEITLTVTDSDGFTATDSLWVEVRTAESNLDLTQLDISGGFNVDSLFGANEMKALYLYRGGIIVPGDPSTYGHNGTRAQGYAVYDYDEEDGGTIYPTDCNRDIGWLVWSVYKNGHACVVNDTRETYTTYLEWQHPQYVDGTEGLPESGYLAGAAGVDYYMASSSGNPVMPGDLVEAADAATLKSQLGPNGYNRLTSQGMSIMFNTMAVGCDYNTYKWQKTESYAELPAGQQAAYPRLNCVLAAFNSSWDADWDVEPPVYTYYRGRYMRLAAVYADDTEEIIWAWDDENDTTPRPVDLTADHPDFAKIVQTSRHYDYGSWPTYYRVGQIVPRDNALYEFAAPLTLNPEKVLKGLRLYDNNPTVNQQPRGIAIFAATAGEIGQGWGPPNVSVATEDGLDWVYENIPASLERGGHRVGLTVTVNDLNGNDSVAVTLRKKADSGPGETVFADGATDLEKLILGSDRNKESPTTGDLVIEVVCQGNRAAEPTTVEVPFKVRPLGDLDGNGGAEPTDMSLLINKLNGMDTSGFHKYAFDLDKNGGSEPTDLSLLVNILNGVM